MEEATKKRAASSWARTGRPARVLQQMSETELQALAELTEVDLDEEGKEVLLAVEDFHPKMSKFIDDYYESRKASEDEDQPTAQTPAPTVPEEGEENN